MSTTNLEITPISDNIKKYQEKKNDNYIATSNYIDKTFLDIIDKTITFSKNNDYLYDKPLYIIGYELDTHDLYANIRHSDELLEFKSMLSKNLIDLVLKSYTKYGTYGVVYPHNLIDFKLEYNDVEATSSLDLKFINYKLSTKLPITMIENTLK